MYCPRCATEISEDKRFCPACGLELATVAEIVAGRFVEESGEGGRERLTRWGTLVTLFALMIGCLIPIAIGLKHTFPHDATLYVLLGGLAGLVLFAGAGMLVYADSLPKSGGGKKKARASTLAAPPAASALPPAQPAVPVSSVTEHTTRPLKRR